jgi:hypothetical protein
MIVCACKLKMGTENIAKEIPLIPLYVVSFFSFLLSYILKKANFGLVSRHIFMIKIITKEDGLCSVSNLKRHNQNDYA